MKYSVSNGFSDWLREQRISIAVSTYQSNRVIFISSRNDHSRIHVQARSFERPMGMYITKNCLTIACKNSIWEFSNFLQQGSFYDQFDALYAPSRMFVTGSIDIHELGYEAKSDKIIFANTQYDCISTLSKNNSFEIEWIPPFLSRCMGDDRAHINGLCFINKTLQFASMCSQDDQSFGWKKNQDMGGILIDITNNQVILERLSMPHSPRFYDGRRWILNSGLGQLGFEENGKYIPICELPGFTRGLAFCRNYALIGLSKLRSKSLKKLPIEEKLSKNAIYPDVCGIFIFDIQAKRPVHYLLFDEPIRELFDIQVLPHRTPMIVGTQDDLLSRFIKHPFRPPAIREKFSLKEGDSH